MDTFIVRWVYKPPDQQLDPESRQFLVEAILPTPYFGRVEVLIGRVTPWYQTMRPSGSSLGMLNSGGKGERKRRASASLRHLIRRCQMFGNGKLPFPGILNFR